MFKLKPQITRYHLCLQGRFNLTHSISMCYEHPCWSFVGSTPRKRPALVQSNDWSVCLFPYIQFSSIIRSKEWNSSCQKVAFFPNQSSPTERCFEQIFALNRFLVTNNKPLGLGQLRGRRHVFAIAPVFRHQNCTRLRSQRSCRMVSQRLGWLLPPLETRLDGVHQKWSNHEDSCCCCCCC